MRREQNRAETSVIIIDSPLRKMNKMSELIEHFGLKQHNIRHIEFSKRWDSDIAYFQELHFPVFDSLRRLSGEEIRVKSQEAQSNIATGSGSVRRYRVKRSRRRDNRRDAEFLLTSVE